MSRQGDATALGFDHGRKRIGVAVGQSITGTAVSLVTLAARDGQPVWEEVSALIDTWKPRCLVVGIPLHLDGGTSDSTRAAERFARQLEGRYRLPVHLVDERLTSREAESRIHEQAGRHGKSRTGKADVDKLAAQLILQDWLDRNEDNHGSE